MLITEENHKSKNLGNYVLIPKNTQVHIALLQIFPKGFKCTMCHFYSHKKHELAWQTCYLFLESKRERIHGL